MPADFILPAGLFPPTPTLSQETLTDSESKKAARCHLSVGSEQILIQIRQRKGRARASAVVSILLSVITAPGQNSRIAGE